MIRTIDLIYHSSKYILRRKIIYTVKWVITIALEIGIIAAIVSIMPQPEINGYIQWIIQAIKVTLLSSAVIISINFIIHRKDAKGVVKFIKNMFKSKNMKQSNVEQ